MNLARAYGAMQSYQHVGAEASVTDADPHHLVQLLLQGALDRIAAAKGHLQRGEVAPKGEAIGKAMNIVAGLRGSLNLEAGGEIARNLEALYDYVDLRLLEANLKNDAARLDEVARLLGEIKGAWDAIAPRAVP
jgi:flagellar protein FliS